MAQTQGPLPQDPLGNAEDVASIPAHERTNLWLMLSALIGGSLLIASFANSSPLRIYFAGAGGSLISAVFVIYAGAVLGRLWRSKRLVRIAKILEYDSTVSFVADQIGVVHFSNSAARQRFAKRQVSTMADALREVFARPSAVVRRLQSDAETAGGAHEEVISRGGHMRLSVQKLPGHGYLWRMEEIGAGPARHRSGTGLPMLTVGRANVILFMNDAARQFCGTRVRSLERIFPELPLKSGGFALALSAEGTRNCLVHIVEQTMGRREVYFLPMMEGDGLSQGGVGEGGLDLLPLAILRLDGLGRILGANCAAQTLLRLDLDAPCFLEDVLEGPGRPIRDWLALALEDSAASKSEFLRVKQRDRDFFVQVSLTQVEQSEGRRLLAVLSDVTEIKTLEEQFAQSQKMQAIGELAGGIAHDFNNLLTAISGHCDLLLRHRDTGDSDYADLVQIRQNSNRAAALVGQLLAFSRKQTLRPEVIDLRDVLAELAHLLNRLVGERVSLMLEIDPDIHNLRADRRQLEQVMMNLVVNARDAMGGQGQILIAAGNQSIATPLVRDQVTVSSGDYLVIEVEDAGCGIPPDLLQKVFEPFYTTKGLGKGTGLGLSTVYGIVKQSGGFVFVDSVVGEGTRVSLMFPAVQEAAVLPTPAPRLPAAAPVDGEGVILLVEDEAPVRAFASRALRLSGFTVLEAASAEEALDLLEDPGLEVDLFLTDVIMPGLDGPTWVRRALRSRPNVRVIFVSGYAEDAFDGSHEDIMRAEFLPKPFSLEDLTKTVQAQFLAEAG